MSRRLTKQLIYGLFYLVFFGAIITGLYFLFVRHASSCFDNTQNQGEEDVDCGGPCARACIPRNVKPVALIGQVRVFKIGQDHLTLLAQINNPNQDFAIRNFAYGFSLYDGSGNLARSFSGNSFLYAGEVKYVIIPNVSAPKSGFNRADFSMENPTWVRADDFKGPPLISVQSSRVEISGNNLTVTGQVANRDTVVFPKAIIVAVFRGQLGQLIAASKTEIENLSPNESRSFSVIHPFLSDVDVGGTKVFVYAERP